MSLSVFQSLRLCFVLLSSPVVCLASWSFPPSEQTTFQSANPKHVLESRLQIQKLLHLEGEVISFCRLIIEKDDGLHHAEDNHHDSEHIKRFLTETQRINEATLNSADAIERHPVLVFRLKRRITVTWLPILEDIRKCEFISTFLRTSIGYRFVQLSAVLLRESDLRNAIDDILFLQRFYCLATVNLVSGCIHGACVDPLTLDEVNDIAQSAVDREDYGLALEWIEAKLSASCGENCPASSANDQLSIRTIRASALLMEGRYAEAKKAYNELFLVSNSSSLAIASILRTIEERHPNNMNEAEMPNDHQNGPAFECDSSPCHCQIKQRKEAELPLMCYSLKLSTFENTSINVETLNGDPKIVMIYDFLGNNQIDFLRTTAKRKDPTTPGSYSIPAVHRIRLSSDDHWMDMIESHHRNITYSQITDWVEEYKQDFHLTVTSVGVGQKNSSIWMDSETTDEVLGRHVGQFHVFLNEPEFGGCLIFPMLKVKVQPTQGAAVFWQFRRQSSRSVDEAFRDLLECPVLLGTQWVAKIPLLHPALEILNF